MVLHVDAAEESAGRWIAEVVGLDGGIVAYGATREEAVRNAQAAGLRVLADAIAAGETDRLNELVFKVM